MSPKTGWLEVDGASIYFEDHGDTCKSTLFLITPGIGTCLYFQPLIPHLLPEYRVVTFDRRGFNRSHLWTQARAESILEDNAEDCAALISHLSPNQPVSVFTSSGNSTVGLELLRRCPKMISRLVLHEPVIPSLLPPHELAQTQALVDEVLDAFSKSGPAAANRILMPHVSTKRDLALLKQEPVLQELAALPPDRLNMYFATELPALVQYEVDMVSLVAGADRVILAHGEPPSVPLSYYPVRGLGDILEKSLVDFPGGHNGYVTHPKDFAIKLIDALRPLRHKL